MRRADRRALQQAKGSLQPHFLANREAIMRAGSARYLEVFGPPPLGGWIARMATDGVVFERGHLRVRATLSEPDFEGWGDLTVSVSGMTTSPTSQEVDEVRDTFIAPGADVERQPGKFITRMVLLTGAARVEPRRPTSPTVGSA